ncbi:unnamed protein product [Prunus armeniaca]
MLTYGRPNCFGANLGSINTKIKYKIPTRCFLSDPLYLARSSAAPTSPPTSASLGLEIDGFPFLFHFPLARPGSEINGFISEVFLGACCRFRLVAEKTTKENLELNTQEFESELIFSA